MKSEKLTIGRNVLVTLVGYAKEVPAKVDTGADSSSVWASDISVLSDGRLRYVLFDKDSPFYNGEYIETKDFSVAIVRSSTGHEEIRYRVTLPVLIKGKRVRAAFNLSNRSYNHFPVLIGRRLLNNKFLVDVSIADDSYRMKPGRRKGMNEELSDNPYAFYQKYHAKDL